MESPEHFAAAVALDVASLLTGNQSWVATDAAGVVVGFVLVERRFEYAAEIVHVAVSPNQRSEGVGTSLMTDVLDHLRRDGVQLVHLKTLDESAGYQPFERTRAFWKSLGFLQIDTIEVTSAGVVCAPVAA